MNENERDKVWQDFMRVCADRLLENLRSVFGDKGGPMDEMLKVAHETAVIVAIEVNTPTLADPIYDFYEKVIKEIWDPSKPTKRSKRNRR